MQYVDVLYIKRLKLTPLMNFSKLLVLLKSNLKVQIYTNVIAKQNIINSRAEFPMKIYHSVSRNLPVPRKPAKIVLKSTKLTRKIYVAKKSQIAFGLFSFLKKSKRVEKRPKITNLASTKPNWQPWSSVRVRTGAQHTKLRSNNTMKHVPPHALCLIRANRA